MKNLYIDTSDSKQVKARITIADKEFVRQSEANLQNRSQETLKLIDQALEEADISLSDIDKIIVMKGPGSFTGLRVGISVANALSFCLQKDVNNKKISELELPVY